MYWNLSFRISWALEVLFLLKIDFAPLWDLAVPWQSLSWSGCPGTRRNQELWQQLSSWQSCSYYRQTPYHFYTFIEKELSWCVWSAANNAALCQEIFQNHIVDKKTFLASIYAYLPPNNKIKFTMEYNLFVGYIELLYVWIFCKYILVHLKKMLAICLFLWISEDIFRVSDLHQLCCLMDGPISFFKQLLVTKMEAPKQKSSVKKKNY